MPHTASAPLIPQRFVSAFLHKPCDDWTWLKRTPRMDLLRELAALKPKPPRADGLMTQQLAALFLGIALKRFGYWYGMGTGKTLVILRLIEYWHSLGSLVKAVVVVPSQEAVTSWQDECEKWEFPLPFVGLSSGTTKEKWIRFSRFEKGLVIISYPSLRAMTTTRGTDRHGKQKDIPDRTLTDAFRKDVALVAFDECTESKNKDTLNFRICRALAAKASYVYGLAGRPFGRDPTDLWAQQFLIDKGESLGPTLGLFRAAFFDAKPRYFGGPYSYDYKFRKTMTTELNKHSGHRSLYWATDECVDLPPLSRIQKRFLLPKETWNYYERVVEHMIGSRGDEHAVLNDFIRLRQLSSGFLGVANDTVGAKCEIEFDKNPKLDLLIETLERLPRGCKAVVFHEFIRSGRTISAALAKKKIVHRWLWAGTKDRTKALHDFQRDEDCEVLVLNHMLGAYALNLQAANYVFYFESPVGCIDREQSEFRCWRTGQAKRVTLCDLVMAGGVDERILAYHREGNDLSRAILRNPGLLRLKKAA